jgi:hypothetical protein
MLWMRRLKIGRSSHAVNLLDRVQNCGVVLASEARPISGKDAEVSSFTTYIAIAVEGNVMCVGLRFS